MPSFVSVFRQEWASWKGPFLPQEVTDTMRMAPSYVGDAIVVSIINIQDITLLRARAKVPADALGARELEIARQIADGNDYKTIALKMGISPATVKTHTTNIYTKLGINDKARLASELGKAFN